MSHRNTESAAHGFHAGFARVLPDAVAARGVPANEVWSAMGLSPAAPLDDARVSTSALCQALDVAIRLTGDRLLPLHAAQAVRPLHLGSLGYALMSSAAGGDGLAVFSRFQALLCDEFLAHHRVNAQRIEVRHEPMGVALPRQSSFWWFLLGARLCFARWVSGRELVPLRLDLPCPRPPHAEAFDRLVSCPVRYDTPDARELMPAAWLEWLNPNADASLHHLMAARTAQKLAQRPSADTLLLHARQALADQMTRGLEVHLDAIVAVLNGAGTSSQPAGSGAITPRQLQRRLAEQGLSFKELVEEVRRDRALQQLRDTNLSIADVALSCGYTEVSPFHRAIRRWTGLTPAQVRQQALDAPGPA